MQEKIKVILDTNILISLLIGRNFSELQLFIQDVRFEFVFSKKLLQEFKETSEREKFQKYFDQESVNNLIEFFENNFPVYDIYEKFHFEKDEKDSFLFDLIEYSKPNYLITGDKLLLEQKNHANTEFIPYREFKDKFLTT